MSITPLPTAPTRSDPANFASRGDAFMTALPTFATEVNAVAATIDSQSAQVAIDAAAAAEAAIICPASVNFKGNWSSLSGPLNMPASVYHLNQFWVLSDNLADVTAKIPGTAPEWLLAKTINALPSFTAHGAITAGQPVAIRSDGKITAPAASAFATGAESSHQAGTQSPVVTYDPVSGKLVRSGRGSAASYARAQVGTIDPASGTISWGAESANISSSTLSDSGHAIVADTVNNKIVLFYTESTGLFAAVGTITGTTIAFTAPVPVDSGGTNSNASMSTTLVNRGALFDAASGKILLVYRDKALATQIALGTVAGGSITFEGTTPLDANFGSFPSLCYVPHINGYVLVGKRLISICTISGSTISMTTPQIKLPSTVSGSDAPVAVYCPDTQQVAFVYNDTTTYGNVVMGIVTPTEVLLSNITVNFCTTTITNFDAIYHKSAKKLQIVHANALGYAANVDGSVLQGYFESTPTTIWKSSDSRHINLCYDTINNVTVATYRPRHSRIIYPYYTTAQDFIGFAQNSAEDGGVVKVATTQYVDDNQSGLIGKTKYYVTDNGALTATMTPTYAGLAVSDTSILVKG